MELKECMQFVQEGLRSEICNVKRLSGAKRKKLVDVFQISSEADIYFNDYNVFITDHELMTNLAPFFKKEDKVMTIEMPEHNVNLWVFNYFNNQHLSSYLPQ